MLLIVNSENNVLALVSLPPAVPPRDQECSLLPAFSRLSFSLQPQQPHLLKSRWQKVLGIFVKLLNLAASQSETALKGADAVWEMIEIWHSCGRQLLNLQGQQAGP